MFKDKFKNKLKNGFNSGLHIKFTKRTAFRLIPALGFSLLVLGISVSCGPGLCTGDGDCRFGDFHEIGMYSTNSTHSGNLGGRSGADSICQGARPPGYNHFPIARAYISINGSDTISNMPSNFNVPDNKMIKFNGNQFLGNGWYDLLDSTISIDLASAGAPGNYWTGATFNGSLSTGSHCSGWTIGSSASNGRLGDSASQAATWIDNNSIGCDIPQYLLCIAYYPKN